MRGAWLLVRAIRFHPRLICGSYAAAGAAGEAVIGSGGGIGGIGAAAV